MTNQQAIRVLIADDQPLVRDGLAALLSLQAGLEIVGGATNGVEAVEQARVTHADIILMDHYPCTFNHRYAASCRTMAPKAC